MGLRPENSIVKKPQPRKASLPKLLLRNQRAPLGRGPDGSVNRSHLKPGRSRSHIFFRQSSLKDRQESCSSPQLPTRKPLENEDRTGIFLQESPPAGPGAPAPAQRKPGSRSSSFSLPVIDRTEDHIPLVLLKKGEDLPDVFKGGWIQWPLPEASDIHQHEGQGLALAKAPFQLLRGEPFLPPGMCKSPYQPLAGLADIGRCPQPAKACSNSHVFLSDTFPDSSCHPTKNQTSFNTSLSSRKLFSAAFLPSFLHFSSSFNKGFHRIADLLRVQTAHHSVHARLHLLPVSAAVGHDEGTAQGLGFLNGDALPLKPACMDIEITLLVIEETDSPWLPAG